MMRRLILIITLLALVLCPSALLGKGTHYSSRSHHSRSHTALHVRHHRSHSYATKYEPGQTYKTTGEPKVERSESAKEAFLRAHGYRRVPPGYEVDHIIPLSE
ncbi:MAG TPA: hypothetical protein VMU02_03395, partial [bacterium]|nr:hypothetical protein [bacterium]